jgi:hypothetical protein
MSGMVAERLFGLLPRHMPLHKKYELTAGMWEHFGPSSKRTLRVGADASLEEVVAQVRDHIASVVSAFRVPESMERRFAWLAQGDVRVKQQMLDHLREQEKRLVIGGARDQIDVLLDKFRADSERHISRMAHVFKIGKHELEVLFESDRSGVPLEDHRHPPPVCQNSYLGPWIAAALVLLVALALLAR